MFILMVGMHVPKRIITFNSIFCSINGRTKNKMQPRPKIAEDRRRRRSRRRGRSTTTTGMSSTESSSSSRQNRETKQQHQKRRRRRNDRWSIDRRWYIKHSIAPRSMIFFAIRYITPSPPRPLILFLLPLPPPPRQIKVGKYLHTQAAATATMTDCAERGSRDRRSSLNDTI